MSIAVSRMTKEELRELIEDVVEQKILELLKDPDRELSLRESLKERLKKQKAEVLSGKRGKRFEEVVKELDLE